MLEVWWIDPFAHEAWPVNPKRLSPPAGAREFVPKAEYDKLKAQLDVTIDLLHRRGLDLKHESVQGSRTRDHAGKAEGQLAVEWADDHDSKERCEGDSRAGESA